MPKYYRLLLCGILLLFSQLAFAQLPDNLPPDINKIVKRGTLIIALYHKDTPPFVMHDAQGNLTGYEITLAKNLAQSLGVKPVFINKAMTFDDMVTEVATGEADMAINLLSATATRALYVSFSNPYLSLPNVIVYNRIQAAQSKMTDIVKQMKDETGIKIGVLNQSSYVSYVKKQYPNAQIVFYLDSFKALQDIKDGKLFAFYTYQQDVQSWLNQNPADRLYINYNLVKDQYDPVSIAVSWQSDHLLNWVNWYLALIQHNGVEAKLRQTYLN